MDAKVEIDRASMRKMEQVLADFERLTKKTAEDGIIMIAKSSGRRLVHTVQPYGTNQTKGKKFQQSIGYQVDRAWFGTNLGAFPHNTDMQSAHYAARRNGVVPQRLFRKEKGKPWLGLISEPERDRYKKTAQEKAGRAKGAWVEASDSLGGTKLSGIAPWIQRHDNGGYGSSTKSGTGMKFRCELHNRTPYLFRIQTTRAIAQAVAYGLKNGFKRMQIIIDKEIEKANRELQ